jgi:hypothetical protein
VISEYGRSHQEGINGDPSEKRAQDRIQANPHGSLIFHEDEDVEVVSVARSANLSEHDHRLRFHRLDDGGRHLAGIGEGCLSHGETKYNRGIAKTASRRKHLRLRQNHAIESLPHACKSDAGGFRDPAPSIRVLLGLTFLSLTELPGAGCRSGGGLLRCLIAARVVSR